MLAVLESEVKVKDPWYLYRLKLGGLLTVVNCELATPFGLYYPKAGFTVIEYTCWPLCMIVRQRPSLVSVELCML